MAATSFKITAPLSFLVIGECGDGKSSLIKHFSDLTPPDTKQEIIRSHVSGEVIREAAFRSPETGSARRGVTKVPQVFPVMIGNRHCLLYDTPGFGDTDVPPDKIMAMIHNLLDYAKAKGRELHGVIVCKTMINRSTVGSQIAGKLTKLAFQGKGDSSLWDHVLLVGTKMDCLRDEDPDDWCEEMRDLINEDLDTEVRRTACMHVFQPATEDRVNKRTGRVIKGRPAVDADVADLERAICDFPETTLTFCPISAEDMVDLLNSTFRQLNITADQYKLTKKGCWSGSFLQISSNGVELGTFFTKNRDLTPLEKFRIQCTSAHGLCSFLSSIVYDVTSKEELGVALEMHVGRHRISYTNLVFAEEANVLQPAAIVVSNRTMYVAWRGTKSIMDMILDLQAAPTHCNLWHDLCPHVKAHNAMKGLVEHNFLVLMNRAKEVVKEHKVTRVVFSGHSLGGGLAQVALLAAFGQCHDKFKKFPGDESRANDLYQTFQNVEFSAVTFAAPMVFNFAEEDLSDDERVCVETLKKCSINYVFAADVVPRLPGHVAYWKPALTHLAKSQISLAIDAFAGCDVSHAFTNGMGNLYGYRVGGAISGTKSYTAAAATGSSSIIDYWFVFSRRRTLAGSVGVQILAHWFGELSGRLAQKKIKAFLDTLPDDLVRSLEKYKHTAEVFHINEAGEHAQMTNLLDVPFELTEHNKKYLLEHHSVCPNCVGDYMIKRRQEIMEYVKATYFPDTEE